MQRRVFTHAEFAIAIGFLARRSKNGALWSDEISAANPSMRPSLWVPRTVNRDDTAQNALGDEDVPPTAPAQEVQ